MKIRRAYFGYLFQNMDEPQNGCFLTEQNDRFLIVIFECDNFIEFGVPKTVKKNNWLYDSALLLPGRSALIQVGLHQN